jgi:hypothetical protein
VPASLQGGPAGSVVTFTGTVTNRDSSVCAQASFSLGASVPSGWSTSTSPAVVSLAPGQASDFNVTVASSTGAALGTYSLTVSAADTAVSSHQASASVSYSLTSLCVAKPPVLTVSPSAQSGAPGTTVTYAFGLTNADGGGCASTSFIVSANVPAGWSTSPSLTAITLKPGATTSLNIAVTSALTTAFGTFSIPVSALDAIAASHGTAATATYAVADTSSPTAPTGLTAAMQQRTKQIQLAWSASSDNVAVAGYRIFRNGTVVGTSSTTSWADANWVAGSTYTYSVVAYDAAATSRCRAIRCR